MQVVVNTNVRTPVSIFRPRAFPVPFPSPSCMHPNMEFKAIIIEIDKSKDRQSRVRVSIILVKSWANAALRHAPRYNVLRIFALRKEIAGARSGYSKCQSKRCRDDRSVAFNSRKQS